MLMLLTLRLSEQTSTKPLSKCFLIGKKNFFYSTIAIQILIIAQARLVNVF